MKIDYDKLLFFIINICLTSMVIVISIFLVSICALLIDGVIDIIWGEPCVCEGVAEETKVSISSS